MFPDLLHGLVTDASGRIVYDSFESLLIVLIADKTEIGNHILYLLALVERKSTEYTVREGALTESLLEYTRLRVSTVKYRKITEVQAFATAQFRDFVGNDLVRGKQMFIGTYFFAYCCDDRLHVENDNDWIDCALRNNNVTRIDKSVFYHAVEKFRWLTTKLISEIKKKA